MNLVSPTGEGWDYTAFPQFAHYPDIDLNNLFKYAVPVTIDKIMSEQECSSDLAYAILFKKWLQKLELDIPNHEGTLYWTIEEIFKSSPPAILEEGEK
jgi:hypothetical protein